MKAETDLKAGDLVYVGGNAVSSPAPMVTSGGPNYVYGCPSRDIEIKNIPSSAIGYRVRMNNTDFAKCFVRYTHGIEVWYISESEDGFYLCNLEAKNFRSVADWQAWRGAMKRIKIT